MKNANAQSPHASVDVSVALVEVFLKLEKLVSDLDEKLTVREPIGQEITESSEYIRRSPRFRSRFT